MHSCTDHLCSPPPTPFVKTCIRGFLVLLVSVWSSVFAHELSSLAHEQSPLAQQQSPTKIELALLNLHNQARTTATKNTHCAKQTHALKWNEKLAATANTHSKDMNQHGFLTHKGSDNSTVETRLAAVKYRWLAYGENISHGQTSPEAAVQSWLESPAHCANLMNPDFKEMGAAKAGLFWTVIFGRRP